MKYKNYYKILGLASAKVSDEEIKSAYRHLAKLYHPDLNAGNDAIADKFKDVNEAYQILGNTVSRKKYDRVYFAYKFRDGLKSEGIKDKINVNTGAQDFFSMFFGRKEEPKVVTNIDKYYSENRPIAGENLDSEIDISLEEAFFGGERKIAYRLPNDKLKTISVNIPRGLHSGEMIRLSGQGKEGKNGGQNGDMFIKVNILPHNKFEIDGLDLITELPLTPWEAALGCEVSVEGLDSNILLNVPEGTVTGDKFRIANGRIS
ncbi:MAG: J domain-containing protein [Clostridia bacterium]|nr:J domain-containing protein [Clostridia bacterium]